MSWSECCGCAMAFYAAYHSIFTRKLRNDNAKISSFFLIFNFYFLFCYALFRPHIPATNAVRLSSDY